MALALKKQVLNTKDIYELLMVGVVPANTKDLDLKNDDAIKNALNAFERVIREETKRSVELKQRTVNFNSGAVKSSAREEVEEERSSLRLG